MKILYHPKALMQRYRPLLHILDLLIERGHQVFAYKRSGKRGKLCKVSTDKVYNPLDYVMDPWDIDRVGPDTLVHLCRHLGLKVKCLSGITWLKPSSGKISPDLILATDHIAFKSKKGKWMKQVNLPYNEFYCKTLESSFLVGNGMCEELRNRQVSETERKGQLLIVHPGGGRNIISPLRKHVPKMKVVENNIALFNGVLSYLPKGIRKVVIKTHPAPYVNCDRKAFNLFVKPRLFCGCEVEVVDSDLVGHICKSEYVLTFGSSTILWLLGSGKKWLNLITGMRDKRLWPSQYLWPQNIEEPQLNMALSNYANHCAEVSPEFRNVKDDCRERHNLPCAKNVLNIIEKGSI